MAARQAWLPEGSCGFAVSPAQLQITTPAGKRHRAAEFSCSAIQTPQVHFPGPQFGLSSGRVTWVSVNISSAGNSELRDGNGLLGFELMDRFRSLERTGERHGASFAARENSMDFSLSGSSASPPRKPALPKSFKCFQDQTGIGPRGTTRSRPRVVRRGKKPEGGYRVGFGVNSTGVSGLHQRGGLVGWLQAVNARRAQTVRLYATRHEASDGPTPTINRAEM
ncbi:hypothetical protein QBC34DRAFT_429445 [Podospora aff. communis PSN243]|uniref:Uncharacterized protein n=1 Tax=Podospora aff. communis PSN243 TaxID=3040156 RepID=A0AAV9G9F4_9PEZI|nr:hypothetical protein QBC34DRAFT_429445 [Podospora aff. communis PSN243]